MRPEHVRAFSRRRFLGGVTFAETAGFFGVHSRQVAAEPRSRRRGSGSTRFPGHRCNAAELIAEHIDWRFLTELKKESKG